jgi:DNA-binding NarL/FixJ family response regulator
MRRIHSSATVLVGENSLLKEGIAKILRSANFRIVASVSCADDLLTGKVQLQQVLFLLLHTGDNFEIVADQIERLRGANPSGRIAVVAGRYRLEELIVAFRTGANGYFIDVMRSDVFIKALELVMMGETVLTSACLPSVLGPEWDPVEHAGPRRADDEVLLAAAADTITPQLSPRERSILRCLIDGESNKSIARKIEIAEATVKVHVKAILRKIRVHNRTQAAIWGMNNGWQAPAASTSPRKLAPGPRKEPTRPEMNSEIAQNDRSMTPTVIENEATTYSEVYHLRPLSNPAALLRKGEAPFRR